MGEPPQKESRVPRDQKRADSGPSRDDALDLVNRDPHHHNAQLKLMFDDIFAEPHPSVHSYDRVWTVSFQVFRTTKTTCYQITSFIFAVPASICWALYFALLSCCRVWCCLPCIRAFEIHMQCVRPVCSSLATSCLRPFAEIFGACCDNFKIVWHRNDAGRERFSSEQSDAEEQGFVI